jgi:hypothetical protein
MRIKTNFMRPFISTLHPSSKQMSTDFVKQTLRENLTRVLVPHVADGLWSIYDNAKTAAQRNNQPEQVLTTFQNLLTRVPLWSDEILNKEVDRISVASKCDYIEDLLLGVFVSYIRAFASLQQVESPHVDIQFERPSVAKFIHAFYKASARASWSTAYLFKTIGVSSEQQARNRRDIETILAGCLNEVIDSFIPWKDISKAYFRAREDAPAAPAAPAPAPAPAPEGPPSAPKLTFGKPEVVEFETDDEEDSDEEEEERPRLALGEEVPLDIEEETKQTANIDVQPDPEPTETMTMNL